MQKTLSVSQTSINSVSVASSKLCSSLKSTDYWTFRVFNEEEDDLLDTVHDFSSAMYDNFHHLAPEIEAFGSLCENETSGSHCTRRCAAITSATFISSGHTRSKRSNGLSIQSRFGTRVPTPTTIQRNRLYTQADEDDGSAGHRMYMWRSRQ
jgi:hypothetical protein